MVKEICSVSDCIAKGPENWIDKWKHNKLGFYDTEKLALSIIKNEKQKFLLYAYKLFPLKFENLTANKYSIPIKLIAYISKYTFLGYDIVCRMKDNDFFDCSPLSCNYLCETYSVNQCCLVNELENAYKYCLEELEELGSKNWGQVYFVDIIIIIAV